MRKQQLSGTLEDYLEAVWTLQKKSGHAHVQDIADHVGVHKSTVSTALQSLVAKGLVDYKPYQTATLTEQGTRVASEINRKHRLMRRFMTSVLLLDIKTADENACRIEHALDARACERLAAFMDFVEDELKTGAGWLDRFKDYIVTPRR